MTPEEHYTSRSEDDEVYSSYEHLNIHDEHYRWSLPDPIPDYLRQAHIDIPINLDDLINSLLNE